MMTLGQNKQKMHYALYEGEQTEYVLDENGNKVVSYVDDDGNVYYEETGRKVQTYNLPKEFNGNIAMSGGEINTQEYGIDVSGYDAILVLDKGEIPIEETSLVWFESEPQYKDAEKTIVDGNKADYRVIAVEPSLNMSKYILKRLVK